MVLLDKKSGTHCSQTGARLCAVAATVIAILLLTSNGNAQSQQAGAAPRQFDVVSIKENVNGGPGAAVSDLRETPGRASLTNVSLRTLIQVAYQVQPRQLVGEPDWVNNSRFDLLATTSGSASVAEMRMMLRPLLEDRFGLVVHTETREVPVYALILARRDGKLDPNLKVSTTDCQANGARPGYCPAPRSDGWATAGLILPLFGQGRFQGRGLRMANVASALNNVVDRTIVDKTGLTEPYEFDLTWTPDALLQPGATANGQANITAPSLFTALQEQLGLKLEPEKGPEQVLVVDKVQKPAEN